MSGAGEELERGKPPPSLSQVLEAVNRLSAKVDALSGKFDGMNQAFQSFERVVLREQFAPLTRRDNGGE